MAVLLLDFEVLRWTLRARWGIRDRLDADVEIPFLYFSHGFLDQGVKDYHNFWGFPQGGRDQVPNNQFHYEVSLNGKPLYHFPRPGIFAISDASLNIRYLIHSEEEIWPGMAVKFSMKFPTGNSSGYISIV